MGIRKPDDFYSMGVRDHSQLTGLTTGDPHTQYFLLAGRAGGQTANGGTASGEHLVFDSTAHATKGLIKFRSNAVPNTDGLEQLGQASNRWAQTFTNNGIRIVAGNYAFDVSNGNGLQFFLSGDRGFYWNIGGAPYHILYAGASSLQGAQMRLARTSEPIFAVPYPGTLYNHDPNDGSGVIIEKILTNSKWVGHQQREYLDLSPDSTVTVTTDPWPDYCFTLAVDQNLQIDQNTKNQYVELMKFLKQSLKLCV